MAEEITDPDVLKQLDTAPPADKLTNVVTDPDLLKQLEGFEGSEPSIPERFIKGAARAPEAIMEMGAHLLPKKEGPTEEKTKGVKLPQRQMQGFDPVEEMGGLLSPAGPATGLMLKAASPIVKGLAGPVGGAIAGAMQPVGGDTDRFWSTKAGQAEAGFAFGFGTSLAGKGVSRGMEAVGDWLLRNHPDNIMNSAVNKVLGAIARDEKYGGMKAQNAIDLVDQVNAGTIGGVKQPMRMADIGSLEEGASPSVQTMAGYVARKPGEGSSLAKAEMKSRDKEALTRLDQAIGNQVSSGPTVYEATKLLNKQRSAAAKPAYEALDTMGGIWSPRLQEFFGNPRVQAGLRHGFEDERDQALAENRPFNPHSWGVDLDVDGNIKLLKVPNMHVLDMAKRGLDRLVSDNRDPLTGKLNSDGRTFELMRKGFVEEIDNLDTKGLYKRARATWAGPSASLDAMKQGKIIFSQHPEEIDGFFKQLSSTDREFYKLGVADIMRERIGKTGFAGDDAKAVIKSNWMRRQLRPIFKTEDEFNQFADIVGRESTMFRTMQGAIGGSPSGERLLSDAATQGDLAKAHGLQAAGSMAKGHWFSAIGNFYRMHRDLGMMPDPKMNEAIAKILFSGQGTQLLRSPPARATAQNMSPRLMQAGRATEDISAYLGVPAGGMAAQQPDLSDVVGTQ